MEICTTSSSSSPPSSVQLLIPSLPDELSLEILRRLPVKSLVKFTTISKPWNLLINSKHFHKTHLSISLSNPPYRHYLLHFSLQPHATFHRTPLHSLNHSPVIVSESVPHSLEQTDRYLSLVGSIDGLVCLSSDNELIFWNPSLMKHRRLPRLNAQGNPNRCCISYGLGYDSVGDDFKVVAVLCVIKGYQVYENEFMVYSGNTNSWKSIPGCKEGLSWRSGIFLNGKLHWNFQLSFGDKREWSILSIDVGDESFGELDQPDHGEHQCDAELGIIGECICLVCNDGQSNVDFWVMKEYGMRESWSIFASISCLGPERHVYKSPWVLLNNRKMLLVFESETDQKVVLYNLQDDTRSFLDISGFCNSLESMVYVESLVLP